MATYTKKYNLKKPDETDFIDIADINENMDKIATALDDVGQTAIPISEKAAVNGVATLDENGKIPAEQLSAVGILPRLDITAANRETVTVTDGTTTLSEISTGTVSFNLPNLGDWRIEAGSYIKTVKIDTVKIYQITALTLNDTSWEQIAEISELGKAADIWSIGDEKNITINNETYTFQIYGFNHDNITGGGKAGITFGMKHLMDEIKQMNSTNTNADSFTGSAMYSWLENTIFPALPENLRSLIKLVDKKTSAGLQSTTIKTESMKLFLFSPIESGLRIETEVYKDEGKTYPIFTDNASRIKCLANGTSFTTHWWERSPCTGNSTSFCNVQDDGSASYTNASAKYSNGICFGFCV